MAKIREDLIGITIVRDASGQDHPLGAGAEIPKGFVVGDHLLAAPSGSEGQKSQSEANTSESAVPSKRGPGSGAPAWRAYAMAEVENRGLNIEIPDDASRDDIITALEEAQIPTE